MRVWWLSTEVVERIGAEEEPDKAQRTEERAKENREDRRRSKGPKKRSDSDRAERTEEGPGRPVDD